MYYTSTQNKDLTQTRLLNLNVLITFLFPVRLGCFINDPATDIVIIITACMYTVSYNKYDIFLNYANKFYCHDISEI